MRVSALIVASSLLGRAAAQSQWCAMDCMGQAISDAGCSPGQVNCICPKLDFDKISCCVYDACSDAEEAKAAVQSFIDPCKSYYVSQPDPATFKCPDGPGSGPVQTNPCATLQPPLNSWCQGGGIPTAPDTNDPTYLPTAPPSGGLPQAASAPPVTSAAIQTQSSSPEYIPPYPVPSEPVPSEPVPPEPVPSEPVPPHPVPPHPVPPHPVPPHPVPSEPVPFRTSPIFSGVQLPSDPTATPDSTNDRDGSFDDSISSTASNEAVAQTQGAGTSASPVATSTMNEGTRNYRGISWEIGVGLAIPLVAERVW